MQTYFRRGMLEDVENIFGVNTVKNRPLKRYDKTTAIMSSLNVVLRARTVCS